MKKKLLLSMSSAILGISLVFGGVYAFGSGKIKIVVNGQTIETDVAPKNEHGRVLVPISTISKALGANVSWNSKTQTVAIRAEETGSKDIWNQTITTDGEEWG